MFIEQLSFTETTAPSVRAHDEQIGRQALRKEPDSLRGIPFHHDNLGCTAADDGRAEAADFFDDILSLNNGHQRSMAGHFRRRHPRLRCAVPVKDGDLRPVPPRRGSRTIERVT